MIFSQSISGWFSPDRPALFSRLLNKKPNAWEISLPVICPIRQIAGVPSSSVTSSSMDSYSGGRFQMAAEALPSFWRAASTSERSQLPPILE